MAPNVDDIGSEYINAVLMGGRTVHSTSTPRLSLSFSFSTRKKYQIQMYRRNEKNQIRGILPFIRRRCN